MASKYWLKLFHETIYDPKVMMMSPGARLRFYECLCLAGDWDRDGQLPPVDHMAFVFRITTEQLQDELQELIRAGIVEMVSDIYVIKKFHDRQDPMTGSERMSRLRDSKRHEEYLGTVTLEQNRCDEPVTNRQTDTDIDIDKEQEEETEKINNNVVVSSKEKEKTPLKAQAASMLTARMVNKETLKELLQVYKPDLLIDYCHAYDQAVLDKKAENPGWLIKALRQGWNIEALLKRREVTEREKLKVDNPAAFYYGKFEQFVEH